MTKQTALNLLRDVFSVIVYYMVSFPMDMAFKWYTQQLLNDDSTVYAPFMLFSSILWTPSIYCITYFFSVWLAFLPKHKAIGLVSLTLVLGKVFIPNIESTWSCDNVSTGILLILTALSVIWGAVCPYNVLIDKNELAVWKKFGPSIG